MEVSLIFDPVTREDLNTDFKCVAKNPRSVQSLHTTVKEGRDLGDTKRKPSLLNALWVLDRVAP